MSGNHQSDKDVRGVRVKRALRLPSWHMLLAAAGLLLFVPAIAWIGQGGGQHPYTQGDATHSGAQPASVVTPEQTEPGMPLVSRIERSSTTLTVLVSPVRPGWNLVRVEQSANKTKGSHASTGDSEHESATLDDVQVGTDERDLVDTRERAGATGRWARVWLPRGESQLLVASGSDHVSPIPVDTGAGSEAPAASSGPDGPECASAAVGILLGDGDQPLSTCPAERLTTRDADRLRALVKFLAGRQLPGISLVSDGSARSREAARLVSATAKAHDLPVDDDPAWAPPENALLVLSGWEHTARRLDDVAAQQSRGDVVFGSGIYLAPWLLNPSLLSSVPNALLPLSFDIREGQAVQFSAALRSVLPGEYPTASAYVAWRSTQKGVNGPAGYDDVRLYATSQVAIMPSQPGHARHEQGVSWFPGGTITPVTNALPTR